MDVVMRFGLVTVFLVALSARELPAQQPKVFRVDIVGEIDGGMAPYTARGIREAERAGARAVILNINTPGGRLAAAKAMADTIREATIPVYAFVNPRAYSAGALIALASDGIYMMPGAVLGAATPVDAAGTKLPEKYV